jgi:simple sugar transport system substrate-binding protein
MVDWMRLLFAAALRLIFIVAFAAGLGVGNAAFADEPLKVAFVYVGPVGDAGWTYAHDQGRQALEKALGPKVKTTYVENVAEGADAERVIRQLATEGNKVIFTTSFGFMNATVKVAQSFPNVIFEHATGYKTAKNLGVYEARFYEGAYLLGVMAGQMTKTNTLGFVASFPIPEVIRNIDAYTLGAQSVNPKVKTKVIWVNTWYDPAKERQAAETLIAQGADMLCQNTDSPAIVQVAQEKGIYAFGWDSDMRKFAPKSQLTANTNNWGVYYIDTVKKVLAGTWKPEVVKWGLKEGIVVMAPLNSVVPPAAAKVFEEKKQAIIDGKLTPFQGPIKDQSGAVKVPAGSTLPLEGLMSLNWYVEGVEGSIPK